MLWKPSNRPLDQRPTSGDSIQFQVMIVRLLHRDRNHRSWWQQQPHPNEVQAERNQFSPLESIRRSWLTELFGPKLRSERDSSKRWQILEIESAVESMHSFRKRMTRYFGEETQISPFLQEKLTRCLRKATIVPCLNQGRITHCVNRWMACWFAKGVRGYQKSSQILSSINAGSNKAHWLQDELDK